jgi:ABC-2 type transport system permease protein
MIPLLLALLWVSPFAAMMATFGTLLSAGSATAIQLFFQSTAKRSGFRRRQTASRASTFCEAFSSISWAGAAALAAIGSVLAAIPAVIALAVLGIAKILAPRRA